MSSAFGIPTIQMIAPAVQFPPPPPPLDPQALPHTGMLHLHDTAGHASAHLADAAGHAVHQAADAALQALGSLSGVLLVGRAALIGTRLLAAAAVRAAEEQRCLQLQQQLAATAAEQWEAAAFAAARINARRQALLARAARATARGGPPGPPPHPDLPPPLAPVGEQLGALRRQLARAEEALGRAEEQQAAWEQQRLTALLRPHEERDDDWQRALRESRKRALERFSAERTAGAEAQPASSRPAGPGAAAPRDPEEVRRCGADILGGLDPYAAPETAELAAQAVRKAVDRAAADPRRARIHLTEARKFVRDANQEARETREAQERAALHYDFLAYETPEGAEDLPAAPEALALLRRTLDDGRPLTRAELDLVETHVTARHQALEAIYVRQQCTEAVAMLAERYGGRAGAGRPEGQEIRLDLTPEGWEKSGHWLRSTLVEGRLRVATMYRGAPGQRTPEQRALDDKRCAEARELFPQIEEITGALGLDLGIRIEQTEGALPGVLGEDAVLLDDVLEEAGRAAEPRRDVPRHAPRHRTAGGGGHR
ncbi:hypothetical protein A6P39_010485 [Streptomyces sp. FXJ1.172]|uniref:hypothetical protein n=1 Tax=Streptomyces sp. FXJ1.172 TaxID=710705 RepID=UPI000AD4EB5E|nr:hypothetical protein [Streptomyces sp. FXJ1.172]WEO94397.1 hypothetical protein A6P39_010485 [Streptomyces sp. FXJ1.172]